MKRPIRVIVLLALLVILVWMHTRVHAEESHCNRLAYPLTQLRVELCRVGAPTVFALDQANYFRLKGEIERCMGHPIIGTIKICHTTIVPTPGKGKEVST